MRETIRCCIACILPCGALDVVRIVHANGRVEEIGHGVKAGDVMRQNPKHVLRKPPSTSTFEEKGRGTAAVILPPTAELKRGKIYFLIPVSSAEQEATMPREQARRRRRRRRGGRGRRKRREAVGNGSSDMLLSDRYLTDILSEKSTQSGRRRERAGVWRPNLETIFEVDL